MADITGNPACFIFPVAAEVDAPKVIETLKKIEGIKDLTIETKKGAVVAAAPAVMERLKSMKPASRSDLAAALAAGKNAAIYIAVASHADLRRVAEETMPKLPEEVGGGSMQLVSRGLTWAALSLDITPKLDASLVAADYGCHTGKKIGRPIGPRPHSKPQYSFEGQTVRRPHGPLPPHSRRQS